jgi:hypothetical protein
MKGASAGDIERFLKRVHAVFTADAAAGNGAARQRAAKAKQPAG